MTIVFLTYGIAVLLVILGFMALLKQKTYLDPQTNSPIEVEVPFAGKLRTNYPALVFLFLGFALAFYAFHKTYPPPPVEWRIEGSFVTPDDTEIEFSDGTLTLFPCDVTYGVGARGSFEITAKIRGDQSFEEAFQAIKFTHDKANADIILKEEYRKYLSGDSTTQIENATKNMWVFKPITMKMWE